MPQYTDSRYSGGPNAKYWFWDPRQRKGMLGTLDQAKEMGWEEKWGDTRTEVQKPAVEGEEAPPPKTFTSPAPGGWDQPQYGTAKEQQDWYATQLDEKYAAKGYQRYTDPATGKSGWQKIPGWQPSEPPAPPAAPPTAPPPTPKIPSVPPVTPPVEPPVPPPGKPPDPEMYAPQTGALTTQPSAPTAQPNAQTWAPGKFANELSPLKSFMRKFGGKKNGLQ